LLKELIAVNCFEVRWGSALGMKAQLGASRRGICKINFAKTHADLFTLWKSLGNSFESELTSRQEIFRYRLSNFSLDRRQPNTA